jgi:hypothetical protein
VLVQSRSQYVVGVLRDESLVGHIRAQEVRVVMESVADTCFVPFDAANGNEAEGDNSYHRSD